MEGIILNPSLMGKPLYIFTVVTTTNKNIILLYIIMPYVVRKIRNKNLYSVKNSKTNQVHSYATTKTKAMNQIKLLRAIEHGFIPQKQV